MSTDELRSSNQKSTHTDLVALACGLEANSHNMGFQPGPEAIARWAALMFASASEIERLTRERDEGWKAFYALRKSVAEERYPGMAGVIKPRGAVETNEQR